jgi:hypothetical protein
LQNLTLQQLNVYNDSSLERNFVNLFPTANIRWRYTASGSVGISYNGSTQQPQLTQIQPLADNTDPLNIRVGNPNLKPAFNHNINFNFGNFKTISNRNIWISASLNIRQNAFSTKDQVDGFGRRTYQTVNVKGNYSFNIYTDYSSKMKFFKLNWSLSPRLSGSRNINFINGVENRTTNISFGPAAYLSKYIEKKLEVYIYYSPNRVFSKSSINPNLTTQYWTQDIDFSLTLDFLKGFKLKTAVNAQLRQKTNLFTNNNNVILWDATLERKLFKKKDLAAYISANDILNQNKGFNRSVNTNYISENTYNTVQRFFLIGFRWKFNKNGRNEEE